MATIHIFNAISLKNDLFINLLNNTQHFVQHILRAMLTEVLFNESKHEA